jgi:NADH-ubiquinone oxidoreductase chain 6
MISTITLIILAISINIFIIINPLSIGISILLIALLIAILFSYSMSSWVAFLIFLIYISGILVIFSYFVSLRPNQTINILSIIITILVTYSTLYIIIASLNIKPQSITLYNPQPNIFYLQLNSPVLIILALILLITIIIVVKLTITNKGPLRPFNYV